MDFLQFLSEYRTPAADLFFQGVTYLAQETAIVAILCWLYWCANRRLACALGFSFFASGLCVQALKITFRIPRPWLLEPGFQPVASAVEAATGYSFPSGHTQSATSLLSVLAFSSRRALPRLLCILGFLTVGFSRMYLGVHTPMDVGVSMLVTLALSAFSLLLFQKLERHPSRDAAVSLALLLICAALLLYAWLLWAKGTIAAEYAMDCFKAGGAGLAFSAGFFLERRFLNFAPPSSLRGKLIRFAAGIAVTLLLQGGLKLLFPETLFFSALRYFLLVFWILVLYPLFFIRFCARTHPA